MLILVLLISNIGIDQFTKILARWYLKFQPPSHYFGGILTIVYSENPGAFLSLGAGMTDGLRLWIFTIGVTAFLVAATVFLFRNDKLDKASTIALTLMVGGGIGNLIDRVMQGAVTDFLHLGIGALQTGVFNVADMAIMAGTGIFLYTSIRAKPESKLDNAKQ